VWLVGEMAIQNGIGGIDYMLQRVFNPLTEHYFSHQSNRLSVVCVVDRRDDTEWNRRNCVCG
jgi:hypothetical protein